MKFLFDHLLPGSFKPVYCDTDSMTLATTRSADDYNGTDLPRFYESTFGPIIRPEMRESWDRQMSQWFVLDLNDMNDSLKIGKLKREFQF